MCRLFRDYLTSKGFVEIHTPKIISGVFRFHEPISQLFVTFSPPDKIGLIMWACVTSFLHNQGTQDCVMMYFGMHN